MLNILLHYIYIYIYNQHFFVTELSDLWSEATCSSKNHSYMLFASRLIMRTSIVQFFVKDLPMFALSIALESNSSLHCFYQFWNAKILKLAECRSPASYKPASNVLVLVIISLRNLRNRILGMKMLGCFIAKRLKMEEKAV